MENIPDGKVNAAHGLTYRSGVAARLAGLSVETLRVWERRYGVCNTERSEHGQRLYSAGQVRRLGLLKQLVDGGHPIGMLARLTDEQLGAMSAGPAMAGPAQAGPVRVAVVGEALARRIAGAGREGLPLYVQKSCARLDQVAHMLDGVLADVLLVEMSEPDETALSALQAARDTVGAAALVVLYRFCSSAIIRTLRGQGMLVARVPAETGELVLLCRAALAGQQLAGVGPAIASVTPRRYDDATLAGLSAAGNSLACECPRHLADILLMLGSFERYSVQCASRTEADAQLHGELGHAAGLARAILEQAMARLVQADNLLVPGAPR